MCYKQKTHIPPPTEHGFPAGDVCLRLQMKRIFPLYCWRSLCLLLMATAGNESGHHPTGRSNQEEPEGRVVCGHQDVAFLNAGGYQSA